MRLDYLITSLIVCLLVFNACSGNKNEQPGPTGNESDRAAMLTHIADELILPAYDNFEVKLDSLISKSDAFRTNPTLSSLATFRQAWEDAYIEWQKVELYDVGPASENALISFFNLYPAEVANINTNIASGTANLEVFESYKTQGFPALDYLINGLGSTDEEILSFYTTAPDASKRLAYLLKLTTQMEAKFNKVQSEWVSFRPTFISKTSMDMYASTSLLVNGMVYHYEKYIRWGKIAVPSGAIPNGPPQAIQPEYVEAYYKKDLSLTLAKTAHQAFIDFFNGKSVRTGMEGSSLKTYLNSIGAKDSQTGTLLSELLNTQFTVVNDKMNLLQDNLSEEVQTNNASMLAVFNEMQKAVRLLKVDMTSAMSVTITYTDNDGD